MATKTLSILWFKRDFRVVDHAPLQAALASGYPILPLYIMEPNYWAQDSSSSRHWQFIRDCLIELDDTLTTLGQPLICRVGEAAEVFAELSKAYKIAGIYAHQETGIGWTYERDKNLIKACHNAGIPFKEFPSNGVVRLLADRDKWGAIRAKRMQEPLITAPQSLLPIGACQSDPLPETTSSIIQNQITGRTQKGGRNSAQRLLAAFLSDKAQGYLPHISNPGQAGAFSSRLSPHLAFGSLSEREVFHRVSDYLNAGKDRLSPGVLKGGRSVLTRLSWRSHFIQKLEDQPEIETRCMHPMFEEMRPKIPDEARLTAWAEGQTGYPIIDSCMRCVKQTGWLPFRMRAMLVSFASYHLWLDWRTTAPVLARYFTDFEPGIHYSQFQMQSGVTGINTIRIYNPVKQSYDHDKKGVFIKKYVPELASLPEQWVHEPHRMSAELCQRFGVIIGKDYPYPIVDNTAGIREAKNKMAEHRRHPEFGAIAASIYQKLGSRSRPPATRKPKPVQSRQQLSLF